LSSDGFADELGEDELRVVRLIIIIIIIVIVIVSSSSSSVAMSRSLRR